MARVVPAYEEQERWSERLRAALQALLSLFEEEPDLACLTVVQALGAGQAVFGRRQRLLVEATAAVDEGRLQASKSEPPSLTADGVVGAVFSVIHARLLEQPRPPLVELTNDLMSMIVLPYLGPAAARKQRDRPLPHAQRAASAGFASLRELDMRLTYRTMRVLLAIGAHPGASNRQIAQAVEINDQGQVSKLLRRLQDLGLIANAEEARFKGERNAWTLTERGVAVREAISAP